VGGTPGTSFWDEKVVLVRIFSGIQKKKKQWAVEKGFGGKQEEKMTKKRKRWDQGSFLVPSEEVPLIDEEQSTGTRRI